MHSDQVIGTVATVSHIVKELWFIVPIVFTFIAYIYARRRTGSSGFIRERLWRILGGGKDFNDVALSDAWKQVKDFERFRFKSGIKVKSSKKVNETMSWLTEKEICLEELIKVSRFFDAESIQMKDPEIGKRRRRFGFLAIVILIWVSLLAVFAFTNFALFTVKASGTTFWVSVDSAYDWRTTKWKLTPELCKSDVPDLALKDKEIICEFLAFPNSSHTVEAVQRGLSTQRVAAVWSIIFAFWILIFAMFMFINAHDADDLYRRSSQVPL